MVTFFSGGDQKVMCSTPTKLNMRLKLLLDHSMPMETNRCSLCKIDAPSQAHLHCVWDGWTWFSGIHGFVGRRRQDWPWKLSSWAAIDR